MNRKIALTVGSFGLLAGLSGCGYYDPYYYGDGSSYTYYPSTPGDVAFDWTFAGARCNQAPEVDSVWVSIPGETLDNDGVYPCQLNGVSGIVLRNFYPGDYSFSLEGVGYRGERLYIGSGVFTVDGNVHVSADLAPYDPRGSYAYLNWSLLKKDGSTELTSCREAGVTDVEVRIDGGEAKSYPCAEGTLGQGARSPSLTPGTHQIEIAAIGQNGSRQLRSSGELKIAEKETVSASFGLK